MTKSNLKLPSRLTLSVIPLSLGLAANAIAQNTAFIYEGRLGSAGSPVTGTYDLRFALYDSELAGASLPPGAITNPAVVLNNGLFTTVLDFGSTPFQGSRRWLEIGVRSNGVASDFTMLAPRQEVRPSPYAIFANVAGSVTNGAIHAGQLHTLSPPGAGQILTYDGSSLVWQNPQGVSGAWTTSGNGAANGNFLGTLNNVALDLRVNNARALRLEPNATSPNVLGGWNGNLVDAGVAGATIGGGGANNLFGDSSRNRVSDNFGVIGGGAENVAGNGLGNLDDAYFATVGGGHANVAAGIAATVAGGSHNRATNESATIGGGYLNEASGVRSTVGGGYVNRAADWYAAVAGGQGNSASATFSSIGGGLNNTASGGGASVGGGANNTASGNYAAIAGGQNNMASGLRSSVGGGYGNEVRGADSTINGGRWNLAQTGIVDCVISGGSNNTLQTNANGSAIGGGANNTILGSFATISGGSANQAGAPGASIGGGEGNKAGWFYQDLIFLGRSWYGGEYSTISGGLANSATGYCSTVSGGLSNRAGGYCSFAAGKRAVADSDGAFAWADSQEQDFDGQWPDSVNFRCRGGVTFASDSRRTSYVFWAPGNLSWMFVSDRDAKEHVVPVDTPAVLEKLSHLPLAEWSYKGYPQRHLGPMAQDFHRMFPLNDHDKSIDEGDLHGVALAAIQGLNQKVESNQAAMKAELTRIRAENAGLKERLEALERIVRHSKSE